MHATSSSPGHSQTQRCRRFQRRRLVCAIGVALPLMLSGHAHALGLGQIQVNSKLGQPLDAVIPILQTTADDTTLKADVPGYWEHQALGFAPPVAVDGLRVEIVELADGGRQLSLTTRNPVKEPVQNFVVRLSSTRQEVTREVGFLLDPPIYNPVRAVTPTVTIAPAAPVGPVAVDDRYGPVRSGETLNSIARRLFPGRAADQQNIVALLFELNNDAFLGGDPDRLMAGSWLNLPREAQIQTYVASVEPTPTTSPATPTDTTAVATYGPVRQGETLYGIARQLAADSGRSIPALIDEIVAANPHAFVNADADRMLQGSVLTLPSSATASVAAETVDATAQAPTPQVAAQPVTELAEVVATPEPATAAVLAPAAADTQVEANPEQTQLTQQLAETWTELEASKRVGEQLSLDLTELNQKIQALEARIATQDERVAALQQRVDAATANLARHTALTAATKAQPKVVDVEPSSPVVTEPGAAGPATPAPVARSWMDRLSVTPTTIGAVLAVVLLVAVLAWFLRYRSRKSGVYLDHRDQHAEDVRERLAELRDNYESEKPENNVVVIEPETLADTDNASARGLAMEAAASLAWDDHQTARKKIEQAIQIEPHNHDHQLLLLRILNQSGQTEEAKKVGESLLAQNDELSDDVRAQVEKVYAASA